MDKVTRILLLYSKLIQGEKINKTIFCFENEYSPRSFDRDIDAIRLFLSDTFSMSELIYGEFRVYLKAYRNYASYYQEWPPGYFILKKKIKL